MSEEDDATRVIQSDTFKGRLQEASKAPPSIVCLVGPSSVQGKQWPIKEEIVIGRGVSAEVHIDDSSLSRSHAKLQLVGSDVVLSDLNSTNKTAVNGQVLVPLTPKQLSDNDQIKAGNIVFKYMEEGNIESVAHKEVFRKSNVDQLTQINNKGALMAYGPESLKKSKVLDDPYSVIVFDIDHFKKTNDTFGHAAGDYVLRELAQLIDKHFVRSGDFFARYGGEEFVIVMSNTGAADAEELANTICLRVAKSEFSFEGQKIPVNISIGGSCKQNDTESWDDLFKRADSALYKSKNGGRNQVSFD